MVAHALLRHPVVVRWVKRKKLEKSLPDWKQPLVEACAICCEEGRVEDGVKLPSCSHSFHQNCLGQWLEKSVRLDCPCCRQAIKP
jgi:hypothetical protein